jgi:hypothetical protein
MLRLDRERFYVVYPSFANCTPEWTILPRVLSSPYEYSRKTEAVPYTVEQLKRFGWVFPPQRCELIPGPCGNGIIVAHAPEGRGWYAGTLLGMTTPQGMRMQPDWNHGGAIVEPRDEPGWELGLGKRAMRCTLGASGEHTVSVGESIYWLLRVRPGPRPITGIELLPEWAEHFGLTIVPAMDMPHEVLEEVAKWSDPNREHHWFEVRKGDGTFDWQFAVMLYCGFHLAYVGGSRVQSMHIIATIEGTPSPYSRYIPRDFR